MKTFANWKKMNISHWVLKQKRSKTNSHLLRSKWWENEKKKKWKEKRPQIDISHKMACKMLSCETLKLRKVLITATQNHKPLYHSSETRSNISFLLWRRERKKHTAWKNNKWTKPSTFTVLKSTLVDAAAFFRLFFLCSAFLLFLIYIHSWSVASAFGKMFLFIKSSDWMCELLVCYSLLGIERQLRF